MGQTRRRSRDGYRGLGTRRRGMLTLCQSAGVWACFRSAAAAAVVEWSRARDTSPLLPLPPPSSSRLQPRDPEILAIRFIPALPRPCNSVVCFRFPPAPFSLPRGVLFPALRLTCRKVAKWSLAVVIVAAKKVFLHEAVFKVFNT